MTNVIHGSGKPRIDILTPVVFTDTVASATATSVVLTTTATLDAINVTHVLVNRVIETISAGEVTYGIIKTWDQASKTLNVEFWTNGTPTNGSAVTVKNFWIILPYCQALIESWVPDFISYKLYTGNIALNKRGFYYSAVLDYSQWLGGDIVEYLRPLYRTDWKEFVFYPRQDNTDVSYVVDISPSTAFQIRQARGHRAHKLVRIELIGTRRLSDINLQTPTVTGYGAPPYGGVGYGDQL